MKTELGSLAKAIEEKKAIENQHKRERKEDGKVQRQVSNFAGLGIANPFSSTNQGGERLEKMHQLFTNAFVEMERDNPIPGMKFNAFRLLKNEYGLNYSGIVITATIADTTSAYVLMLEATGRAPSKTEAHYGQMSYEVTRSPGEALTEIDPSTGAPKYLAAAVNLTARRLGVKEDTICMTDGTLVPTEYVIEDPTDLPTYAEFINNSISAIYVENKIEVEGDFGRSIRDLLDKPNARLMVETDFVREDEQLLDAVGMPIKADICLTLMSTNYDHGQAGLINAGTSDIEVLRVYGYIDFLWQRARQDNSGRRFPQSFMSNFIITHMESASSAMTPSLLIAGVITSLVATEDQMWRRCYTSKSLTKGNSKEITSREIGLLNIEGNIEAAFGANTKTPYGEVWKSQEKDVTAKDIYEFLDTLVYQDALVSIDVAQAGPSSWFTSIFGFIANDRDKNGLADYFRKRLYTAIEELVDADFDDKGVPVFARNYVNIIHGGYYMDTNQKPRDLREITSYLGWAAHIVNSRQTPDRLQRFTATFQADVAPEISAAEREKMIFEAHPHAVIKQQYTRLTFTGEWLSIAARFLTDHNFQPINSNTRANYDAFERSSLDLTGLAVSGNTRVTGVGHIRSNFNRFNTATPYHRVMGERGRF